MLREHWNWINSIISYNDIYNGQYLCQSLLPLLQLLLELRLSNGQAVSQQVNMCAVCSDSKFRLQEYFGQMR